MDSDVSFSPGTCNTLLQKIRQMQNEQKEELKRLNESSMSFATDTETLSNFPSSQQPLSNHTSLVVSPGDLVTERPMIFDDSPFLNKVIEPIDKCQPKFPFLRKGQGTAKYGTRKLKGFVKNMNLSSNPPPPPTPTPPSKNVRPTGYEQLEELIEHDSFVSNSSYVQGLLQLDESKTSTPTANKQTTRKINLANRYSTINPIQPTTTNTFGVTTGTGSVQHAQSGIEKTPTSISKVQFQPRGLEILEYVAQNTKECMEQSTINESDMFNVSDLEGLEAMNLKERIVEIPHKRQEAPHNPPPLPHKQPTKSNEDAEPHKLLLLSKIQSLDKEINIFKHKNIQLDTELNAYNEKSLQLDQQRFEFEAEQRKYAKAKEEFLEYTLAKQDTIYHNQAEDNNEFLVTLNHDISQQLNTLNAKVETIQSENRELKNMIMKYQDQEVHVQMQPETHVQMQIEPREPPARLVKMQQPFQPKKIWNKPTISKSANLKSLQAAKNLVPPKPILKKNVPEPASLQLLPEQVSSNSPKNSSPLLEPSLEPPTKLDPNLCQSVTSPVMHSVSLPGSAEEALPDEYPNGTIKTIHAGKTEFQYTNGDRSYVYEDKAVYCFAEQNIVQTVFNGGKKQLDFPNGQKEIYFPDGSYQIIFSNSASVTVYKDGSEKNVAADGTVTHVSQGTKSVHYPNGQKEIFRDGDVHRIWPDGTTKILYKNGVQETQYKNGKVRVKDAQGNVSITKPDTPL